MSKLFRYISYRPKWHNLPMMNRDYSTEYRPEDVDRETAMLMSMTHTRCPQGVEVLKRKHRAESAQELIRLLPPRKRPRRRLFRALSLVRRLFGLTAYDPMKQIAREHMRRAR